MDENGQAIAETVLCRLRRIRELGAEEAPPSLLLGELRALSLEAAAWARLDGDARALAAAAYLEKALAEEEGAIARHGDRRSP